MKTENTNAFMTDGPPSEPCGKHHRIWIDVVCELPKNHYGQPCFGKQRMSVPGRDQMIEFDGVESVDGIILHFNEQGGTVNSDGSINKEGENNMNVNATIMSMTTEETKEALALCLENLTDDDKYDVLSKSLSEDDVMEIDLRIANNGENNES